MVLGNTKPTNSQPQIRVRNNECDWTHGNSTHTQRTSPPPAANASHFNFFIHEIPSIFCSVANPSCSGYQDYCSDYCPTDAQQGNDSPLTCLLTSDEFLMDLFDDGKTFDDENMLLNAFGSGDFDQSLFSVFAEDTFPQGGTY
jgi:hypothetical protein